MTYTKLQLIEITNRILTPTYALSIGLPKAVEETAIQLFMGRHAQANDPKIIKQALCDLRNHGEFGFSQSSIDNCTSTTRLSCDFLDGRR